MYLFKEDGLLGGRPSWKSGGVGENLQNSLVFTWGFMETMAWFWVSFPLCGVEQSSMALADGGTDFHEFEGGQAGAGEEEAGRDESREGEESAVRQFDSLEISFEATAITLSSRASWFPRSTMDSMLHSRWTQQYSL